ncbi:hypothetical protein, partial [Maritimibacter sp. 55A14]|uniref:hypothetical protein n=1 Tax=Maritimibacter sp. 55A14 TaxID=2174844 RepID=UPI001E3BEA29
GRSRLSYLMAPRLRPLLMPPNDDTQKGNKLDLRVALKKGAGQCGVGPGRTRRACGSLVSPSAKGRGKLAAQV